jgi:hypothetical protein
VIINLIIVIRTQQNLNSIDGDILTDPANGTWTVDYNNGMMINKG